jgi:hypothetical protein
VFKKKRLILISRPLLHIGLLFAPMLSDDLICTKSAPGGISVPLHVCILTEILKLLIGVFGCEGYLLCCFTKSHGCLESKFMILSDLGDYRID